MKTKLSYREILDILRADKAYLTNEFGVINIGLFGSYAKGKQNVDSDIDLLVEFKAPRFDWMAGLQIHLEQKLGRFNSLTGEKYGTFTFTETYHF